MKPDENGIIIREDGMTIAPEKFISEDEHKFIDSIYALYDSFVSQNLVYLNQIREARQIRRLEDPQFPFLDTGRATCPQLNTLNSTMDNMIADYVDNQPEVTIVPEALDKEELARNMTDVMGWVLNQADFPAAWKEAVDDATVVGTGIIQDHYDPDMYVGGVDGNIGMLYWPAESWLPDPMYDDFQQGRAVFKVIIHPISWFYQHYPNEAPYIEKDGNSRLGYDRDGDNYADETAGDPAVCLLEVWYRRYNAATKRYEIHMAKVAGGVLLEDTRGEEETAHGVYAHGMYPFTVLRFRKRKGTAYGTGMVYDFAETQRMINRFIKYIDDNARLSSRFKLLVSKQAGVDMTQLTDSNQEVVLVDQRISKEFVDWFQPQPLNSLIPSMMGVLQDTMKQDSGQNQWARGEGGQSITAASAISMLQNAGSKISRTHINDFMNEFKDACYRIVSMIGQFFDKKRVMTIYGEQGGTDTRQVEFDPKKVFSGMDSYRRPAMSVRILPQRSSPDQVEGFNNKVLKMVELSANSGSPVPAAATAKMLQMTGKEQIIPILEQNDMQMQMLQQLQQQVQALAQENEQLKQGLDETSKDAQNKTQMLMSIGQQMQQQPSLPEQTAPTGA